MSTSKTASQLEARRRIDRALELLERAQHLVGDACEAICPLTPLCDDWERLGRLYDSIKVEWQTMNRVRNGGGYDLDQEARARFLAEQEAGGNAHD